MCNSSPVSLHGKFAWPFLCDLFCSRCVTGGVLLFVVVSPPSSRCLVNFKDPDVLSRFQITTDRVLNGSSTASLTLKSVGQLSYGAPCICLSGKLVPCCSSGRVNHVPCLTRPVTVAGVFEGLISPPDYGDRPNRGGFASFRTLVRSLPH